jgi:hypothetical protein
LLHQLGSSDSFRNAPGHLLQIHSRKMCFAHNQSTSSGATS